MQKVNDIILNQEIDKQKLTINPMSNFDHDSETQKTVENENDNHIKCPECSNGYLEYLTDDEKKELKVGDLGDVVLGCDECQYWVEEDLL